MLVSELRELLKKYKEEDLRLVVSEMYKSMPKSLREDKDIDTMLSDIHAYMNIGRNAGSKEKQVNLDSLQTEIDMFIDYAYKQYYFAPNNIVHKKERPKWRFKVKDYVKTLLNITIGSEEGKKATDLLQKLYKMLSYACAYYLFNTNDPFKSIGIVQTGFLDSIIQRRLGEGISNDSIKSLIELVIDSNVDTTTLHSSLVMTFVCSLKTTDSKEIAIKQCIELKQELNKVAPSRKNWSTDSYRHEEKVNNLVETGFRLNIALCEYDEAIKFFYKNYIERDKEVTLYILLDMLLEYELKDLWLREYDRALINGVKPGDALQLTYKYILKHNKLPEYMMRYESEKC